MTTEETEKGYIYILWNNMYNFYGENVYKIGCTADFNKRIDSYTTSYLEPCEFKYVTDSTLYYKLAEKIIHFELKEYRLSPKREFFKCPLETAIETINRVTNYTLSELLDIKCEMNISPPIHKSSILETCKNMTLSKAEEILQEEDISTEEFISMYNSRKYIKHDSKFIRKLVSLHTTEPISSPEEFLTIVSELVNPHTQATDILHTDLITQEEYDRLSTHPEQIRKKEKEKLITYIFHHVHNNMTSDYIFKSLPFVYSFLNVLPIYSLPIDECIIYARENNKPLTEVELVCNRLLKKNTDVYKWKKIQYALQIIKVCGYTSLDDTNRRKVDWMKVEDFIIEHEEILREMWKIEPYTQLDNTNVDQENRKVNKSSLVRYVLNKIEPIIGLTIVNKYNGSKYYFLQVK